MKVSEIKNNQKKGMFLPKNQTCFLITGINNFSQGHFKVFLEKELKDLFQKENVCQTWQIYYRIAGEGGIAILFKNQKGSQLKCPVIFSENKTGKELIIYAIEKSYKNFIRFEQNINKKIKNPEQSDVVNYNINPKILLQYKPRESWPITLGL